jgi:sugar/nucleoside kinase (ribokinase family)
LWQRDERLTLGSSEVQRRWFESARALHVDALDAPASLAAARLARSMGLEVTSDIEDVTNDTDALIAAATVPIFAEHVMARLTSEHEPERALRLLRQRHTGLLCVTLGARGAMLLEGDRLHYQPALPVAVEDSTSAGDVFRAGLLHGLLHQLPPRDTLRFACAAAAVACTRPGAIASVPSLADVEQLLRQSAQS